MVKFPFNILAPIPKLIQVFLSLFYSGSNPPVMLIGCTQELISNRLFRHAQIRLAELQNSSCMLSPLIVVSPCVWLSSASQPHTPHPAHTGSCSSLPPQHSPLWPAAATNSQLCFSWLLAARELTREPQCSKWCDKKELCRTVFSNDQSDWKRLSSYFSASVERWTSKLLSSFQNPLRIRSKYLNFSNPILYTRVWCHDKAVFLQPLISGLLATLIQI